MARAAESLDPGEPRPGSRGCVASRLQAIGELVPEGSRVADVGTGHGLLPLGLLVSGRAAYCVASERSHALLRAVRTPASPRHRSLLDLRVGDGLAVLGAEDRLDVIVLAGIGGGRIIEILEAGPRPAGLARRLVLQPQTEVERVRRWLVDRSHEIVDERLVHERGRFYFVVGAEHAAAPAPLGHGSVDRDTLLQAGPCLLARREPLLARYWFGQLARLESIRARAADGGLPETTRRQHAAAVRILELFSQSQP